MLAIGSGITRRHGSQVWRIVDAEGQIRAKYLHESFQFILDDTPVYYTDLNLDGVCENVQVQMDIDDRVLIATASNGFQDGSELRLRDYIMRAFLAASRKQDDDRAQYLAALDEKMRLLRETANARPSQKVTLALLRKMGITV